MLRRARATGVTRLLSVSTSCASARQTAALPAAILKAVGVHPRAAAEGPCAALVALARAPGVVAIGETGFDAAGPPFARQEAVFRAQCALARQHDLALVLHIAGAGAWQALMAAADALDGLRVVRHYFMGDTAQADWHAARGHYLSFGRPLLREPALQRLAPTYPPELLLIETDTYPLPGRATEPRDAAALGAALARLCGWTPADSAARLWQNGARAFQLAD